MSNDKQPEPNPIGEMMSRYGFHKPAPGDLENIRVAESHEPLRTIDPVNGDAAVQQRAAALRAYATAARAHADAAQAHALEARRHADNACRAARQARTSVWVAAGAVGLALVTLVVRLVTG